MTTEPKCHLPPVRVLFLCTGNSCRSQMAEGWARHLHGDRISAFSAGTHPKEIDPLAICAMAEVGVDIRGQSSKLVDPLWFESSPSRVDLVVTVCDAAAAACPMPPPGVRVVHAPFDDPPALAAAVGGEGIGGATDDARLAPYRRVREEIRQFVEDLPCLLASLDIGQ